MAHFLHDPRRNIFCNDDDRDLSAEESGSPPAEKRINPPFSIRNPRATISLQVSRCARRPFTCCGSALGSGIHCRTDGHQPTDSLCAKPGIASAELATLGLVVEAFAQCISGRVLSGWLSDTMGRLNALRVVLAVSSVAMPSLYWVGAHLAALYVLIFVVYFCYGAQASVIPSDGGHDFWGTRHAGTNYGALFLRPRGFFWDSRAHDRRSAFRPVQKLRSGFLYGRGAGCGRLDLRPCRQETSASVTASKDCIQERSVVCCRT